MPDRDVVTTFVSLVESGQFIEAIQRFYHPAAIVRENQEKSRMGIDALVENESLVLRTFTTVHGRALHVMVDGDNVAINWHFEFSNRGTRLSLDEIAYQQWSDGKIAHEHFYYDPSQLRPAGR
ncbi:MAG TPA: nuclear transport factor 2 family protein [Rhodanobacter sp.]|nr:nuclear transport factor 2 family protein [Rhodanobacter sp.]